jgi:hypothetical protein
VRKLLAAAQQELKVKLDPGKVDTVFKVWDQVLLELLNVTCPCAPLVLPMLKGDRSPTCPSTPLVLPVLKGVLLLQVSKHPFSRLLGELGPCARFGTSVNASKDKRVCAGVNANQKALSVCQGAHGGGRGLDKRFNSRVCSHLDWSAGGTG